jgi:Ca2+/H+ antiporter
MPIVYIIGVFFSVKSHAHIFEPEGAEHPTWSVWGELNKIGFGIAILIVATVTFFFFVDDSRDYRQDSTRY